MRYSIAFLLTLAVSFTAWSCAGAGEYLREHPEIKDGARAVATTLCTAFGQEHPDALVDMAVQALPPDVYSENVGGGIGALCLLAPVVDLFMPGAQLALADAEGRAGIARSAPTSLDDYPDDAPAKGAGSAPPGGGE